MLVSRKIDTCGHLLAVPSGHEQRGSGPNFYDQPCRLDRVGSQPAGIVISESDVPTWGYDQEPLYRKNHLY